MLRTFAVILCLTLLVMAWPVMAQTDDLSETERDYITRVAAAIEAVGTLETYQSDMQSIQYQEITDPNTDSLRIDTELIQHTDAVTRNNADGSTDTYAYLEQVYTADTGLGPQANTLTMEMALIDGGFFLRFSDLPPGTEGMFPHGWFDVETEDVPGLETIDTNALADLSGANAITQYPITPQTIAAIEQLDPAQTPARTYDRFRITFQPEAVQDVIYNSYINFEALSADENDLVAQILPNTTVTQDVWLDAETDQFYRLAARVTIAAFETETSGQAIRLSQETSITVMLSAFNDPVQITLPSLGQ